MEAMFKSQIRITGKHGNIMKKLCNDNKGSNKQVKLDISDSKGKVFIFETYMQCYMVAAMIGIINKKKSSVDTSKIFDDEASIFPEMLDKNDDNLKRIYKYMVFITEDDLTTDGKVKKAFSMDSITDPDYEQNKLEDYVRGGLEILDEQFSKCKTIEDVTNQIAYLMESLDLIDDLNVY